MEEELDLTKIKYVLYARKSTDDPERQIRSIEDQITECKRLAKQKNLRIVALLEEKESAKKPHKRKVFNQMIADIKKGVYDGIIAWNPDRLARNMLEGGMLIDMVDEEYVKDMQFVTHHFSKDANGKMLLGMAFVLSKQYSDKLSADVTRGMRRKLEEGKSHIPKHGYVQDEHGLYQADEKTFTIVCEAWKKRRNGESIESIADWMNEKGYRRIIKSSGRKVKMTKQILSDLFKDPFYYGILIQGKQTTDLRLIYDFKAGVLEEDYNKIQEMFYNRTKPNMTKRLTYYPFRKMLFCAFCGKSMVIGPSQSKTGGRLLYARCDNTICLRGGTQEKPGRRSCRIIHVLNFIYQLLEEGLHFTEEEYKVYYKGITTLSEENRQRLLIEIHSMEGSLKNINRDIENLAYRIIDLAEGTVKRLNEARVAKMEAQKGEMEGKIAEKRGQLVSPEEERLGVEQFLNLSKKAAAIVKSGNPIEKDQICRIIFLNFHIGVDEVLSYQAKPPFDELLKQRQIISSRGERN